MKGIDVRTLKIIFIEGSDRKASDIWRAAFNNSSTIGSFVKSYILATTYQKILTCLDLLTASTSNVAK